MITPELKANVEIYEEVISNLCNLFIELGISDNPIEIYETFRYMYLKGYLSSKPYYDILPQSLIDLEGYGFIPMDTTGTILLTGYGVCRHTTDFLSYIYYALGYDNSVLSTYHPDLRINVKVVSPTYGYLTNPDGQKYIDRALEDVNLFGKQEFHVTKSYDGIDVIIDYYPPEIPFNHIMNIVKNKQDDTVHIVDTRYHCVGRKIDSLMIQMNNAGLTHIDFVNPKPKFPTFYKTDYKSGLKLLERSSDIEQDIRDSLIYREFCKRYRKKYEEFHANNQDNYKAVTENYKKLIKKLN